MKLTSENLMAVAVRCLFDQAEIKNGQPPADAVLVEGVASTFGFNPLQLQQYRDEIRDLLACLPKEFMADGGGGMTFLNACNDREGNQWTGFHREMDMLFALGQACGFVKSVLPREMWSALPGSMPYYVVILPETQEPVSSS